MFKSVFRLIQISPNSVSKGMILKLADSKYVQVTGKKEDRCLCHTRVSTMLQRLGRSK